MLGIGSTVWHCFYPLWHIVDCHEDVFAVIELWMVPWSQCPKRQIILPIGCSIGALHLLLWFLHVFGIFGIFGWSLWCPHTWLARRIRFARFWHEYDTHHSVPHMVPHDISQWYLFLRLWAHIFSASHRHKLCRGTDHPTSGVYFHRPTSSCFFLVIHTLQP